MGKPSMGTILTSSELIQLFIILRYTQIQLCRDFDEERPKGESSSQELSCRSQQIEVEGSKLEEVRWMYNDSDECLTVAADDLRVRAPASQRNTDVYFTWGRGVIWNHFIPILSISLRNNAAVLQQRDWP